MLKIGFIVFIVFCSFGFGYSLDDSSNLANDKVIRALEENLALARQEGNITKEIEVLNNRGAIYRSRGEYDLALSTFLKSLDLAEENNYRNYVTYVSLSLGITYEHMGDFENAEIFFKKALENARITDDRKSIGNTYLGLGNTYISMGEIEKAESSLKMGLRVYKELNDTIGVSSILNSMGILSKEKGNYSGALDYYNQSLILKVENRDIPGALSVAGNIAVIMKNLGRPEEAEDIYLILLNATRQYGDKENELKTLSNLGTLYLWMKDIPKSLDYQNQALDLAVERGDKDGHVHALINLGNIYLSLNKTTEAGYYYKNGKDIAEEIGNERAIASALAAMGEIYAIEEQKEKAIENYLEASKLFAKFGDFEKAEFLKNLTEKLKNEIAKEKTTQEAEDRDVLGSLASSPKVWAVLALFSILSFVVGIISLLSRRSESVEKKRFKHSVKLREKVIDSWSKPKTKSRAIIGGVREIESFHELGRVFYDEAKLNICPPEDPELDFFDVFKEHLKTGYPEVLKEWENVKAGASNYLRECASFAEEIKNALIKEAGMPQWYDKGHAPPKFIRPIIATELSYTELMHQARTGKKYLIQKLRIEGDELKWGASGIAKSPERTELIRSLSLIKGLVESPEKKQKARNLVNQKKALAEDYSNFREKLNELKKSVELGNYLKGKCKHCPKNSLLRK